METRRLTGTDLEVTRLSFGGIKLSKDMADPPDRILGRALDAGITYIDTARCYGDSEELIGQAVSHRRREYVLSSKSIRRRAGETTEDIETGLRNLRTDSIDIYFCHDISREADWETAMSATGSLVAISRAVESGKVRYPAISTHRKEYALRAIESGAFAVIMLAVNLFDREFITDVLPSAAKAGIAVVGMKPLAGGAFAHPQIALRYSLAQKADTVLVGIASLAELEEDLAIARTMAPLSAGELSKLEDDAKQLGTDFCRQCGYCLPCEESVDIPGVLLQERYAKRFWLDDVAKAEYAAMEVQADACSECGACEERCPYFLPIRQKLKAAHALLTA